MQLALSSLVVLAVVVCGRAAVISLVNGGLVVLPPLSYTAQTVDLGAGLQGAVVAGQPARLVVAPNLVVGSPWIGSPALVLANPAPAAIRLDTSGAPAAVEVEDVETVPVAPAVVNVVAAEAYAT